MTNEDRAVSSAISFAIALGIMTAVVSLVVLAGGGYLSDTRTDVKHESLTVYGEELAQSIQQADNSQGRATIEPEIPSRVMGDTYNIRVSHVQGELYRISLSTGKTNTSIDVRVSSSLNTPVRISSGDIIVIKRDTGSIVITNE